MNTRALVAVALAAPALFAISYAHACIRIDQLARSSEVSTKVAGPGADYHRYAYRPGEDACLGFRETRKERDSD